MLLIKPAQTVVGNVADTNPVRQCEFSDSSLAEPAGFHTDRLPVLKGIAAIVCSISNIDSSLLKAGPQWLCSSESECFQYPNPCLPCPVQDKENNDEKARALQQQLEQQQQQLLQQLQQLTADEALLATQKLQLQVQPHLAARHPLWLCYTSLHHGSIEHVFNAATMIYACHLFFHGKDRACLS